MNARRALAAVLLGAALGACSSSSTGSNAGAPGDGTPVAEPPGTTAPSSSGGSAALQVGANAGAGGALFFNDVPALGEPRISGLVVVQKSDGSPTPADMVVNLNGVDLVHAVLGGTPSPSYFTVDPSGPQPTIGADGFLHLTASSASQGLTRTLHLACPFAVDLTLTPPAGASLSGATSVRLDWTGALPVQGRDLSAFGLGPPTASLHGLDPATRALSFVGSPVAIAPASSTRAPGNTSARIMIGPRSFG